MSMVNASPVSVSTEAARKLPRQALLVLLAVFAWVGLLNREIWASAEAVMLTQVEYLLTAPSILIPVEAGQVVTENGPLIPFLATMLIKLTANSISPTLALRLLCVLAFSISTASIWYGTWFLARRREAQPIEQAFGREAPYRDYGRLVADSATLFAISLFGFLTRYHTASIDPFVICFSAVTFFGCAWALSRPYWGATLSGIGAGALMLTANVGLGALVLLGTILAQVYVPGIGRSWRKVLTSLVIAGLILFTWCWALNQNSLQENVGNYWLASQTLFLNGHPIESLGWLVQNFIWYLCPAWPFTLWALWQWRKNLNVTHLALPLSLALPTLIGFICMNVDPQTILDMSVAPMCTIAAFGLMSTRRNGKSLLEYFSVAVFTLALMGIWAYWLAWVTGFNAKMQFSITRLAQPGLLPEISWMEFLAIAFMTIFWVVLCARRLLYRPVVFWNGPWLSAIGLTVVWLTSITLFAEVIDSNRSYRPIAIEVSQKLIAADYNPAIDCVSATNLSMAERGMLKHFSPTPIRFERAQINTCRYEISKVYGVLPSRYDANVIQAKRPQDKSHFFILDRHPKSTETTPP